MLCVLLRILYPSIGGAPANRACCSCITESLYFSAGALPAAGFLKELLHFRFRILFQRRPCELSGSLEARGTVIQSSPIAPAVDTA
jgi:hypothetical protein